MKGTDNVLEAVIAVAKRAWDELTESVLDNLATLVTTMPHRVKVVLEAEGWYAKY